MSTDEAVSMDTLAKVYIKIRSKIAETTKAYDTAVEQLKRQQDEVTSVMKEQLRALGVKTVRTEHGTIMLGERTRYWTTDWSEFDSFVVTHNVPQLFERRVAQKNMAEFLEKNPGVVPPGLNSETEITVSVRKPS